MEEHERKMTMIREAGQSSHKQNNTKISPETYKTLLLAKIVTTAH